VNDPNRLLDLADEAPLPEWRRPGPPPVAARAAADRPAGREPGKCQACGEFRPVARHWPGTLPGRFAELCDDCRALGDAEIARRLPEWRHDGAVL
jgi:hypothetical protein